MLIAMAGLPGTGKSTIAARLAEQLGGVVLCKDAIRAALFPEVEYTREQDDQTMQEVYLRAKHIGATGQAVIIDGRTFSKAYQIRDLFAAAEAMTETVRIIECVCSDERIRERLERDSESGRHPAANRTYEMYRRIKLQAEPLTVPRLVLDTGLKSLDEGVSLALGFLKLFEEGTHRDREAGQEVGKD